MELKEQVRLAFAFLTAFLILGALLGVPEKINLFVISWWKSILVGFFITAITEAFLTVCGGNPLKGVTIFTAFGVRITLFTIVTIILQKLIFGM